MFKMEPSGSHRASRGVQGDPKWTKLDPREAPMCSRGAQDGSREAQEDAKGRKGSPRGAQREPKGGPKGAQDVKKEPKWMPQRRPKRHRLHFGIVKKPIVFIAKMSIGRFV